MKKIVEDGNLDDDLRPEYDIDYSKVKRNPYFKKDRIFVEVDKEIADAFQNPENINNVLKAIAQSFNKKSVAAL